MQGGCEGLNCFLFIAEVILVRDISPLFIKIYCVGLNEIVCGESRDITEVLHCKYNSVLIYLNKHSLSYSGGCGGGLDVDVGIAAVASYGIGCKPGLVRSVHRSEMTHVYCVEASVLIIDELCGIGLVAVYFNEISACVIMEHVLYRVIAVPGLPVSEEVEEILVSLEYGGKLILL